jgi:hypothetical protein
MLKSEYFWVAMFILVPFTIVWIMGGLFWATGMLVAFGLLYIFFSVDPSGVSSGNGCYFVSETPGIYDDA